MWSRIQEILDKTKLCWKKESELVPKYLKSSKILQGLLPASKRGHNPKHRAGFDLVYLFIRVPYWVGGFPAGIYCDIL